MSRKKKTKRGSAAGTQRTEKPRWTQNGTEPTSNSTDEIFTLADEARQTNQHDHSTWSQDTKLRSMPVLFRSAGNSEPLKTDQINEGNTDDDDDDDGDSTGYTGGDGKEEVPETGGIKDGLQDATDYDQVENSVAQPLSEASAGVNSLFYLDIDRSAPGANPHSGKSSSVPTPMVQAAQPERSDSEGEVILFKGRINAKNTNTDMINLNNIRTEIYAVERELEQPPAVFDATMISEKTTPRNKARGKRGGRQVKAKADTSEQEDDEIIADYIANMRANGEMHDIPLEKEVNDSIETDKECTDDSGGNSEDEEESMNGTTSAQTTGRAPNGNLAESMLEFANFDPMDWERPSLRRKKGKGANQKLDLRFAGLDSETEQRLQAAFRSDRIIKAHQKREREQLRALNLLGKKTEAGDAEDMRRKYPKGMRLDQVADELKGFLLSLEHSITLPPMDKHARKMIHELASKFNVKSKSIGQGDQRRPTLYRTKRTFRFDDEAFDLAVRRIQRRYFPRLDFKGKSSAGQSSRAGYAEASYRDGEVVGGSAPELSSENRGRAMLEKMGWSIGTALGSADNKGILLPVTQTMKRSKAGLG